MINSKVNKIKILFSELILLIFMASTITLLSGISQRSFGHEITPGIAEILIKEDVIEWHQAAKEVLSPINKGFYKKFSNNCNKYFEIPHRNERWGVGGIFFDNVTDLSLENSVKMLESVANPAEKTKTWDDYKAIFIKKKRIQDGQDFIKKNSEVLQKAEDTYHVPKEVITAILGIETNYGKNMGNFRVLDSLTTLGFDDPRRSKFFKSELIQFFLLTRENNLDILKTKGSYAGAMGFSQFISSSYRAYAVDFDGDGYIDCLLYTSDAADE